MNLTTLIDEAPVSRFHVAVFFLCAAVVFLDGIDTQVIGIAAPMISAEHGIAGSLLGWVFSAGTLGATVGALVCGLLADRVGRKTVLVAATACFGAFTLATTLADGFASLAVLRFATGLGLGGAVPCFVALTSEYAPATRRATAVTLLWAALPLGGMTGGFLNASLLHLVGWRALFVVWGVVPLLVAAALAAWLPESVRFLLAHRAGSKEIGRIVERLSPGTTAEGAVFTAREAELPGFALRHLFVEGRAMGTISLCVISFLVFGALTVIAVWTPALLTAQNFLSADAAVVVGFNGLGSFVGTSAAGRLIERFGAARAMIPAFMLAAFATMLYGGSSFAFAAVSLASLAAGVFLGVSSSSVVALSAAAYPTAIRSTGIGWALGFGRFGSVIGPLAVGAMVGAHWPLVQIWFVLGCVLLLAVPCVWIVAWPGRFRDDEAALTEAGGRSRAGAYPEPPMTRV